jgi:Integrase core domain
MAMHERSDIRCRRVPKLQRAIATRFRASACESRPGHQARRGCFGTRGSASIGAVKSTALHFLILTVAGWLQRRREAHIEYVLAENAVYKEHFAGKRLRLDVAGIVREPYDGWMRPIARNLTDAIDGFLIGHRYRIMDRAPVFTAGFRALLAGSGVQSVRLPSRSPNLNAYAERFVRSIRQECLSKVVPLGERHLRELVREYVAHYHGERNHQGLDNRLIERLDDDATAAGRVLRRRRLGGMLNFYYRAAA